VLGRNVRVGVDELDVVALSRNNRTLLIVEVKSAHRCMPAMDRVDEGKVARLQRAADGLPWHWRRQRRLRIDVALVQVGRWRSRIQWHEAAC
jgi:Holliday junction resolvase-like predicted endonuclease